MTQLEFHFEVVGFYYLINVLTYFMFSWHRSSSSLLYSPFMFKTYFCSFLSVLAEPILCLVRIWRAFGFRMALRKIVILLILWNEIETVIIHSHVSLCSSIVRSLPSYGIWSYILHILFHYVFPISSLILLRHFNS